MAQAPCKGCADRHPNCHSSCERYSEYDRERQKIRKEEHENSTLNWESMRRNLRRQ